MGYIISEDIDSCPFCGKTAILETSTDLQKKYHVVCVCCGARTEDKLFASEAISAWNARSYK